MILVTNEITVRDITHITSLDSFYSGIKYNHLKNCTIETIEENVILVTNGINKSLYTDNYNSYDVYIDDSYENIITINKRS